jgi:hypothetical protein
MPVMRAGASAANATVTGAAAIARTATARTNLYRIKAIFLNPVRGRRIVHGRADLR